MTSIPGLGAAVCGSVADDEHETGAALDALFATLGGEPGLLGLGEPTHLEPAFARMRNRIFRALAGRGFRSVAVESDIVAALRVDAYVRDGEGTLDDAMAEGFSHGFGALAPNRELVAWMRAYNDGRPADERLAFHGFDPPLETMSAPSPRRYLRHLHDYLAEHLGADSFPHGRADLGALLGPDERWDDTAAVLDAERSAGASADARTLRAITDDLLTTLRTHAPRLVAVTSPARWRLAETYGTAALGLLRYHARLADPASSPSERWSRLSGVRDALMAENLQAIRARERHRGPTLVFAHNLHLQRNSSAMPMGDMHVEWASAGAIAGVLLDERYACVATSIGASETVGLDAPPPGTYEDALRQAAGTGATLFDGAGLRAALGGAGRRVRTDVRPEQGYFPLDAAMVERCDAVLHVTAARRAAAG